MPTKQWRLKKMTSFGMERDMRKQPKLYSVIVCGKKIDISVKAISKTLFYNEFEPSVETPEYDYRMNNLKKVKQLNNVDKLIHDK